MPEITRKKIINYRRVDWIDPQPETLEDLLRQALRKFSKPVDRILKEKMVVTRLFYIGTWPTMRYFFTL